MQELTEHGLCDAANPDPTLTPVGAHDAILEVQRFYVALSCEDEDLAVLDRDGPDRPHPPSCSA
jgi:hypothetical protein